MMRRLEGDPPTGEGTVDGIVELLGLFQGRAKWTSRKGLAMTAERGWQSVKGHVELSIRDDI
jgi:hypothetical protein